MDDSKGDFRFVVMDRNIVTPQFGRVQLDSWMEERDGWHVGMGRVRKYEGLGNNEKLISDETFENGIRIEIVKTVKPKSLWRRILGL